MDGYKERDESQNFDVPFVPVQSQKGGRWFAPLTSRHDSHHLLRFQLSKSQPDKQINTTLSLSLFLNETKEYQKANETKTQSMPNDDESVTRKEKKEKMIKKITEMYRAYYDTETTDIQWSLKTGWMYLDEMEKKKQPTSRDGQMGLWGDGLHRIYSIYMILCV